MAQSVILTDDQSLFLAEAIATGKSKQLGGFVSKALGAFMIDPTADRHVRNTDEIIIECIGFSAGPLEKTSRWGHGGDYLRPSLQTKMSRDYPPGAVLAAIDWFKDVVSKFPKTPYPHFFLGMAYRFLPIHDALGLDERFDLAISSFQAAIENFPNFGEAYYRLAEAASTMPSVLAEAYHPIGKERTIEYYTKTLNAYQKSLEVGDATHAEYANYQINQLLQWIGNAS